MDAHIEVTINNTRFMCWKGAHWGRIKHVALEIECSSMTRTADAIRWQVHLEWTPSVGTCKVEHAHVVASTSNQHARSSDRDFLPCSVGNDAIEWSKIVGMTRCVGCRRKKSSKCYRTGPRC